MTEENNNTNNNQEVFINWSVLGRRMKKAWNVTKETTSKATDVAKGATVKAWETTKEETVKVGSTTGKGFKALVNEYKDAYKKEEERDYSQEHCESLLMEKEEKKEGEEQ